MKISFNWLKKYIPIEETPDEIATLLTHSGLEVESVEIRESVPGGLKNFVIGQVITCEKHPNANKLSNTTVDVGNGNILRIVCGAPNVRVEQKVIVALPGAEIRKEGKTPFVIQQSKIRGETSEGMICAEDELGLGHSHDGILVLDTDLPIGTPAALYFKLESDYVFEIGLTPNRADAASHFGVARELRALLKKSLSIDPKIISYKATMENPFSIDVRNSDACPRYAGAFLKGVEVGPSPQWLQDALTSIGLNTINNIVDVTNYVLHGLGQPLHAFDADKLLGRKVVVRTAEENANFITLDGKERILASEDLVIADSQDVLCIAGVFGGKESGVGENTTNIFLESAYFHPDYVRKTAQRLGLKTDASFRFERGTNPEMVLPGLKFALSILLEITNAKASELIDIYPKSIEPFPVELKWRRLHQLIGEELPKAKVMEILKGLEIEILEEDFEGLQLSVPPYRVDVQREADIVEEVLRVYGFNNVQINQNLKTDYLASFPLKDTDRIKSNLGKLLISNGFYEIYSNSLTKLMNLEDEAKTVKILNGLSNELNVMRQSLIPSGLEAVAHNLNRKQKELKFFETGFVYFMENERYKYRELQHICLIVTGNRNAETWQEKSQSTSFFDMKNAVSSLLVQLGVPEYGFRKKSSKWLSDGVELFAQNKVLGTFGQVSKDTLRMFDIKQEVFAAELDLDLIIDLKQQSLRYRDLPKFPEVRRDLSLVLDKKISFEEIERMAKRLEPNLLKDINVFDVFEGEVLGKDKKSYSVSYTIADEGKTLTDVEIDAVISKFITAYENELGAVIRR